MIRRGDRLCGIRGLIDATLHVRLSRANPDLAGQHIAQRDGVFPADRDDKRLLRFDRIQDDAPLALVVGGGRLRFLKHIDGDFFTR